MIAGVIGVTAVGVINDALCSAVHALVIQMHVMFDVSLPLRQNGQELFMVAKCLAFVSFERLEVILFDLVPDRERV